MVRIVCSHFYRITQIGCRVVVRVCVHVNFGFYARFIKTFSLTSLTWNSGNYHQINARKRTHTHVRTTQSLNCIKMKLRRTNRWFSGPEDDEQMFRQCEDWISSEATHNDTIPFQLFRFMQANELVYMYECACPLVDCVCVCRSKANEGTCKMNERKWFCCRFISEGSKCIDLRTLKRANCTRVYRIRMSKTGCAHSQIYAYMNKYTQSVCASIGKTQRIAHTDTYISAARKHTKPTAVDWEAKQTNDSVAHSFWLRHFVNKIRENSVCLRYSLIYFCCGCWFCYLHFGKYRQSLAFDKSERAKETNKRKWREKFIPKIASKTKRTRSDHIPVYCQCDNDSNRKEPNVHWAKSRIHE